MPDLTIESHSAPALVATPIQAPAPASKAINVDADIEALFAVPDPAKPDAAPEPPKKPDDKPAAKPEGDKPPTPPAPKDQKKEEGDKIGGAAQLRKAYEESKSEVAALKRKIEELSKPPAEDEEKKTLKQQLEDYRKRHEEADGELKFVNYQKSGEYREKYEQPIRKAIKDAEGEVSELTLTEDDGTERNATVQDFAKLVEMPLQMAIQKSKAWFGDAATEVLAHRRRVVDLVKASKEAIEDYRQRGGEMEKQKLAEREKQSSSIAQGWQAANKHLTTTKAELFGKIEGDDEGNQLLDAWGKFADSALDPNNNMPVEKRIQYLALVRNKAAAFDRMNLHLSKTKEKLAVAEKELAEFRESAPGGGRKVPQNGAPARMTPEQELDALANPR